MRSSSATNFSASKSGLDSLLSNSGNEAVLAVSLLYAVQLIAKIAMARANINEGLICFIIDLVYKSEGLVQ